MSIKPWAGIKRLSVWNILIKLLKLIKALLDALPGAIRQPTPKPTTIFVICLPQQLKQEFEDTKKGGSALIVRADDANSAKDAACLKLKCIFCRASTLCAMRAKENGLPKKRLPWNTIIKILPKCLR